MKKSIVVAGSFALLVTCGLVALTGSSSKRIVEAEEFVLKDANGKVWARLGVLPERIGSPGLAPRSRTPVLSFYDNVGEPRLALSAGDVTAVQIFDVKGNLVLLLTDDGGPAIYVSDDQGYRAVLGSQILKVPRTGEVHQTSAASLLLYGKDGKIIWRTPK